MGSPKLRTTITPEIGNSLATSRDGGKDSTSFSQMAISLRNALDPPELVARFSLQRHQLALTHRQPGQAYCFRKMFLENKTEFFCLLQCLYFTGDRFSQPVVRYLCYQIFNLGHKDYVEVTN